MSNYDKYNNKSYNLRMPDKTRKKLDAIQEQEGIKKLSVLLMNILDEYIAAYEAEHGEIILPEQELN